MKLQFLGAAQEVTGSCFLIEAVGKRLLVDCGLFQCAHEDRLKNYRQFPFDASSIDFVFLTHAHADHTGLTPRLVKEGFGGTIFTTPPTIDLLRVMLVDSLGHLKEEAKELGEGILYSKKDIREEFLHFSPQPYDKEFKIDAYISARFLDAGHILGSASIELFIKEGGRIKTIVFSGDIGNDPSPLLASPKSPERADYIVLEGTYGDRPHEHIEKRRDALENVIEDVAAKGGVLLIPAFALERMQVLFYEIETLVSEKRVPPLPLFLDSPLGFDIFPAYKKHASYLNQQFAGTRRDIEQLFRFPNVHFTRTAKESKDIDRVPLPKIIIASSGMSTGGRILYHERRYLPDSSTTILFANYQARGTRGEKILNGANSVEIFGESVPVRASRRVISGYSAHADSEQLKEWVMRVGKPIQKIFLVHGEQEPLEALRVWLQDNTGIETVTPSFGEEFELS